jgi:hypothetical protein
LQDQIEAEVLLNITGKMSKVFPTWAALELEIPNPKQLCIVLGDAGTHVDPVTTAVVSNSGFYKGTDVGTDWEFLFPLPIGSAAILDVDDDPEMAAASDLLIPTQNAVKQHVAAALAPTMKIVGDIDCSTDPLFPAASKGEAYLVTASGLIGGAFGRFVDQNCFIVATDDNAGGNLVTAGPNWLIFGLPLQAGVGIIVEPNEAGNLLFIGVDEAALDLVIEAAVDTAIEAIPDPIKTRIIGISLLTTPLEEDEVLFSVCPPTGETWTIPDNFAGAVGKKLTDGVDPATALVLDCLKNGVSVGTITISDAGVVSFNTTGGALSLIGGTDIFELVGPAVASLGVGYTFSIPVTY